MKGLKYTFEIWTTTKQEEENKLFSDLQGVFTDAFCNKKQMVFIMISHTHSSYANFCVHFRFLVSSVESYIAEKKKNFSLLFFLQKVSSFVASMQ